MTENKNNRIESRIARRKVKSKLDLKKRVKGKPSKQAKPNSFLGTLSYIASCSLKIILIFVLTIGFLITGFGSGMLAGYISTANPVAVTDMRNFEENTVLLDKNGDMIAELSGSSHVKENIYLMMIFSILILMMLLLQLKMNVLKAIPESMRKNCQFGHQCNC